MDIYIWYTLLSAVIGGIMGARARLGEVLMLFYSSNSFISNIVFSSLSFQYFKQDEAKKNYSLLYMAYEAFF